VDFHFEDSILELCLRRGYLSEEDLASLKQRVSDDIQVTLQPGRWGSRLSLLISEGRLNAEILSRLEEELMSASDHVQTVHASTKPDSSAAKESFEGKNFGPYLIQSILGEGGMGRVYRARDTRLDRLVALKQIKISEPELVQRFLGEARAQARVDHEHICKVYESGEIDGTPYIAMQYIDGRELKEAAAEMSVEEKSIVFEKIADALHAAHRAGLIHRDIKPSNIMVERLEDGPWKPYIMDFGLARDLESQGHTVSGTILGTPCYMPPEQAQGNMASMDRRSDIYSLGASLYEVLGGSPPFKGKGVVEILTKVVQDDPAPLKTLNPHIPRDLETIVSTCMEKDPDRRYDSAKALSMDLRHFLDGDPIDAHPAGILYRISRKIRKHKFLSLVVALALFITSILSLWLIRSRWEAAERSRLTHRYSQEAGEMRAIMDRAVLLPLHDINQERAQVQRKISELEEEFSLHEEGTAAGPFHYALGEGYYAIQDYRKALDHLSRAWQAGFREPELACTLGSVHGRLYQEELRELSKLSKEEREERRQEVEESYRIPAVSFLRMSQSGSMVGDPRYQEAMIAFYEGKFERARKLLDTILNRDTWAYLASMSRGDIDMVEGDLARLEGRNNQASEHYKSAETFYLASIDIARSLPQAYQSLCERWNTQIYIDIDSGQSPEHAFQQSVLYCQESLTADPENGNIYNSLSNAYKRWAMYLIKNGQDPRDALQTCAKYASRAAERETDRAYAFLNLGVAMRLLGEYAMSASEENPADYFDQSERALDLALEHQPDFFHALNNLGLLYRDRSQFSQKSGKADLEAMTESVNYFSRSMQVNPRFIFAAMNLGTTCMDLYHEKRRAGISGDKELSRAEIAFRNALEINPDYTDAAIFLTDTILEKVETLPLQDAERENLRSEAAEWMEKIRKTGKKSSRIQELDKRFNDQKLR